MLCPEAWNIKPPQHNFSIDRRNFNKPAIIESHYFNHSISIVLPDTTFPDGIKKCQKDTEYYQVNALRACDLLSGEFIEAFVKKGEINLMTIENKIDLQNSICITPTGYLILSLVTEDYQALGLEGKASSFKHKPHTRYVTIDLKNESFVAGKKNYERVQTALKEHLKQNFNVIVSWDPPEDNVCPSSIAAWFYNQDYSVHLCKQRFFRRSKYSLTIPILQDEYDIDRFFEWLGIFSIDGDLSNETDNYVNTYEYPSPSMHVRQVQYLHWTGFFTRKKIQEIYDILKEYVLSKKTLPWLSLDVQGFADSPISWNLKEHTFFVDGDNSYTIIFQSNGESVIRKSLSSNNSPRTCNITNSLN